MGRSLLRLAAPNEVVMVTQVAVGIVETFFVGKLGTDSMAGIALVRSGKINQKSDVEQPFSVNVVVQRKA